MPVLCQINKGSFVWIVEVMFSLSVDSFLLVINDCRLRQPRITPSIQAIRNLAPIWCRPLSGYRRPYNVIVSINARFIGISPREAQVALSFGQPLVFIRFTRPFSLPICFPGEIWRRSHNIVHHPLQQ